MMMMIAPNSRAYMEGKERRGGERGVWKNFRRGGGDC